MATYDTAANIVSEAAIELGLGSVSDVYGSADPNIIQLRTLLKSVGRSLVWRHPWLQQIKEYTFDSAVSDASYALPADFQSMVDLSGWNRTANVRMHPISVERWQEFKASNITSPLAPAFRIRDGEIEFATAPTAIETYAFEYRSKYWVRPNGQTESTLDAPTVNNDTINIDSHLITRALKLGFLKAKGFDTTAAQQDFDEALSAAQGANSLAPVLPVAAKGHGLLTWRNAPDTGFGFDGQGGLY